MEPKKNPPKSAETAPRKQSVLDNSVVVLMLSLLCALITWVVVAMFLDPQSSVTIANVPVTYSYQSTAYTAMGLDIVESPADVKVNVRAEGASTIVGGLTKEDIMVYPNYSTVTGAGQTRLNLIARIINSEYTGMNITLDVESPATVEVVFDTVGEKTLPVSVETAPVIADGYTLTKTTAVPAEITLRGPLSELDQIASIAAPVVLEQALSDTTTVPAQLELRDENGNVFEPEYTTADNETSNVTLTVYQVRELPLVVDFINAPSGFDTDSLRYSLSTSTLRVAGPAKAIGGLNELSVTSFDLGKEFAFGRDYQRQVELPSSLVSLDGISNVTVSFDTSDMDNVSLNVSNIRAINVPSNYDIQILTTIISEVQLYGPAEEIAELTADSVLAQIDCQNVTVTAGQQTVPVSIQIPSSTHIFAVGSYSVQCEVSSQ